MTTKAIVIGNGLLAKAVAKLPDSPVPTCYFASGVSNSSCCDSKEFDRERCLLQQTILDLNSEIILIYFSTCSIHDTQSNSLYVAHKREMEKLVAQRGNYIVFRLPQVVGFSNNRITLANYIVDCIVENRLVHIQKNAVRNIIDVDDVATLAQAIINSGLHQNSVVNIANPLGTRVVDLVAMLEIVLHRKARCDYSDSGSEYPIDTAVVEEFAGANNIDFGGHYLKSVLLKYYSLK